MAAMVTGRFISSSSEKNRGTHRCATAGLRLRIRAHPGAYLAPRSLVTIPIRQVGLWLEGPEPVLIARAERRRNDPSDADANVIRTQRAHGAGDVVWCRI